MGVNVFRTRVSQTYISTEESAGSDGTQSQGKVVPIGQSMIDRISYYG